MRKYLILNGPNLNLLGMRESIYGTATLADVEARLLAIAKEYGVQVEFFQSNHEGALIDKLQAVRGLVDGIVFNPGAYGHSSYAIRDAITGCDHRVVEVHITNIHAREEFRRHCVLSDIVEGQVVGLGVKGYELALSYLIESDKEKDAEKTI